MAPEVLYTRASDIFSLGLVFVMISELVVVPTAKWGRTELPLGKIYYMNRPTQSIKPSHLLQLTKGTSAAETRLFNYHKRYNTEQVLKEIKEMTQAQPHEEPYDSYASYCSC